MGSRKQAIAAKAAWAIVALGALAFLISLVMASDDAGDLPAMGIRVVAPTSFLADSPGAVSVIATNHARHAPIRGATVTVRLANPDGTQGTELVHGKTDDKGTLDASFTVPALAPGAYDLYVDAAHGSEADSLVQPIQIRKECQILLVTDKPLYQPSQTIHMRALVTRKPDLKPLADAPITLEVRDPKGNKVFKKAATTNEFGAAWADFQLADEINLGEYECKATCEGAEATKSATVKRYVLPKFKVSLSTDRPFYLPGAKLSGTVSAGYFFGKPVAGGEVTVTARTFDVEYTKIAEVKGRTNSEGAFDFDLDLPTHFVGQPFQQGKAFVELEVKVTDTADHSEKITQTRPVASQEMQILAVPESGKLIPNVRNIVWILVSDPTGKPVPGKVRLDDATADGPWSVQWERQTVDTDDLGIARIVIRPGLTGPAEGAGLTGPGGGGGGARPMAMPGGIAAPMPGPQVGRQRGPAMIEEGGGPGGQPLTGPVHLKLAARSKEGHVAYTTVNLPAGLTTDDESLLLRTDKALLTVGQQVRLTALASVPTGYVYFDLVKDRQTMMTAAADLHGGRADTTLTVGPELAGTVYISAYRITRRGNVVRDTRPVIVEPASDLKVAVHASQDVFRPGQPARVDFDVHNAAGKPAQAALGVSIVDESVFALQDMQPGLERVYAYLEQELRKPRYEIHGLELPTIIARPLPSLPPGAQTAAKVMLASADVSQLGLAYQDSYAKRLAAAKQEWVKSLMPKLVVVRRGLEAYVRKHHEPPTIAEGAEPLLKEGFLKPEDLTDIWNKQMKLVESPWGPPNRVYEAALLSPGPDGIFGTEDDVLVTEPARLRRFGGRGGLGGGMMMERMAVPAAAPAGAPGPAGPGMMGAKGVADNAAVSTAAVSAPSAQPVRVRQFFPETLLFKPDVITGPDGRASVEFNMADSITTWRLTALANAADGELGSTDAPLRCFQDFFVDLDLPVALTQGDQISLPVAVYNYLKQPQAVRLKLDAQPWFALTGDAEQTLTLAPNEVTVRHFTIKARELGDHTLTVYAYGSKMSDAIKRAIRVEPDGKSFEHAYNGRLSGETSVEATIPAQAISGASNLLVKVYPGVFAQVLEGLDGLLRMPFGCFEQTSSVTYPNILVLDYMRTTRQATPEIQMKAEGLINTGYQRLLSFEVPGGGFSWFGNPPANKLLTAMGVMEFYDMNQVYPIDANVISRTQQWLLRQQDADGSWDADKSYLHQETWHRLQNAKLLPTAYITWALASTGEKSQRTRAGYEYVRKHWKQAQDPYQLATVLNALVAGDNAFNGGDLNDATLETADALLKLAKHEGEKMWWESKMTGLTHSSGRGADLEATALAALALINSGRYAGEATQVLNYLTAAKSGNGTWGSTQATVLALKAMLTAQKGAAQKASGTVEVAVNDKPVTTFNITPDTADVMRVADCRDAVRPGANKVKLTFEGEGSMLYQVASKYWLPWKLVREPRGELLDIGVKYDKTKLAVNDVVTAHVRIKNQAPGRTSMIVVDLGVPPGFAVEGGDLAELVGQKTISKYSLTGRQIIVYLQELEAGQEVTFSYRLKALYPVTAKAPASTVYEYYNPDNRAEVTPEELVIAR